MPRVEVDNGSFEVRLDVPGELEVETSTGTPLRLRRWGFDAHLRALGRHLCQGPRALQFDAEGFAHELLRDSGVPPALFSELAPLALWWATAGLESAVPEPDGWFRAGAVRARLRPWTFSERSQALEGMGDPSEPPLSAYLRAQLSASVMELEPSGLELSGLDGATTAALLDAVVALNMPGGLAEDRKLQRGDEGSRALAEVTLRLCRELGWTPSRVWATPAVEVDRLLTLLDLARPSAPAPVQQAPSSWLGSHPDAVVIQVEDG